MLLGRVVALPVQPVQVDQRVRVAQLVLLAQQDQAVLRAQPEREERERLVLPVRVLRDLREILDLPGLQALPEQLGEDLPGLVAQRVLHPPSPDRPVLLAQLVSQAQE